MLSQNNRMSFFHIIRIQRRFLEAKSIGVIYFTLPEAINSCSFYSPRKLSQKRLRNSAHINDRASAPKTKRACAVTCCQEKAPFRNCSEVSYLRQQEPKSRRSAPARRGSWARFPVGSTPLCGEALQLPRPARPADSSAGKHTGGRYEAGRQSCAVGSGVLHKAADG